MAESFLGLQEDWCELKDCVENPELLHEDRAIYEAISHYKELGFRGGAISIDSKVEAFALGEPLNPDTAVIHIEKANPDIPGLYAAINQLFCAEGMVGSKIYKSRAGPWPGESAESQRIVLSGPHGGEVHVDSQIKHQGHGRLGKGEVIPIVFKQESGEASLN